MGERKEYFLCNVPSGDVEKLRGLLDEQVGEGGIMETPIDPDHPIGGKATMWQSDDDPICVTIYEQTHAIHAADVDEDSRVGQLLKKLEELHPCD
jgi:hypothetical protein